MKRNEFNQQAKMEKKAVNLDERRGLTFLDMFPDENLAHRVAQAFNRQVTDEASPEELNDFQGAIWAEDQNISNLEGMQHLRNLTGLQLSNNHIRDVEVLSDLKNLLVLDLSNNHISDVQPFRHLTSLLIFNLSSNHISDLSSLGTLQTLVSAPSQQLELPATSQGNYPTNLYIKNQTGQVPPLTLVPIGGEYNSQIGAITWGAIGQNSLSWSMTNTLGVVNFSGTITQFVEAGNFVDSAKALQEQMVQWRRELHRRPELGMNCEVTAQYVRQQLIEIGYEPEQIKPLAGGFVIDIGSKISDQMIILRADMDGLPIEERSGVSYSSEIPGRMHACGHDLHTSMLLGAAKILKENQDKIQGTIRLMFQPGEETLEGAKAMVAAGVLQKEERSEELVDAALMIHVATGFSELNGLEIPSGMVGIPSAGPFMAASDRFRIQVTGSGGHGSMPEDTRDSIHALCHIATALSSIISREISSSEQAVISIGSVEGGDPSAPNVIPEEAFMWGTIRTYSEQTRHYIHQRIVEITREIGNAFRVNAVAEIIEGVPALNNDAIVVDTISGILREKIHSAESPVNSLGDYRLSVSEDFAVVTDKVPGMIVIVNTSINDWPYPLHSPFAKFDDSKLWVGAATYATMGIEWLKNNR